MTLSAYLAGVSEEDERRCDAMAAAGDELRAAVAWRVCQGKAAVFTALTGIPEDRIIRYADTGEISDDDKRVLEIYR